MKTNYFVIVLLCLALLSSFYSYPEKEHGSGEIPVGTVIYSVLPPNYFLAEHKEWVLLDGRKIEEEWALHRLMVQYGDEYRGFQGSLPNALGRFVRSVNYQGEGKEQNSAENLNVGVYQKEATKKPDNLTMETKGKHAHSVSGSVNIEVYHGANHHNELNGTLHTHGNMTTSHSGGRHSHNFSTSHSNSHSHSASTNNSGDHTHSINAPIRHVHSPITWEDKVRKGKTSLNLTESKKEGHKHNITNWDAETRPKNITLYTYIKVN